MVAVAAVTAALGVVQTWISTTVGQQVMHRLRTDVFSHLHRQSIGFFTRTRTGEVQSRITNDIGGMQSVVTSTATSIASNLTTAIATAVAMAALSWQLSLVSLVVLPPAIWLTRRVARMRRTITAQRQRELADLNVTIEEGLSISGVQLTKTMGTGPALVDRFTASSHRLIDLELRSELAGRWRMASMSIIFAAIPAVIYLSAGLPVTAGTMSIGTLVAFTALQAGLFRPLMGLLNVGVSLTSSLALFARIFEYLDLPVEVDDPAAPGRVLRTPRGPPAPRGRHLRLPGQRRPPPSPGCTWTCPAGTSLGAGRRDRLRQEHHRRADRPAVRPDRRPGHHRRRRRARPAPGRPGRRSSAWSARRPTCCTPRSGRTCATPGRTPPTREIEAAARAAQIHDLIAGLPDGYDTVVGSRGHRFSGGEKQRIAIARTLLRDPRILVLDEATSALDTETERAVQRAFDELARGRTTITIAHRLSTVRDADQIVVLDHGRVLESGTHDTLVDAGGRYAALAA